jgi:hypothetical protein
MIAHPVYGFGWLELPSGNSIQIPPDFAVRTLLAEEDSVSGDVIQNDHLFSRLAFVATKRHRDTNSNIYVIELFPKYSKPQYVGSILFVE